MSNDRDDLADNPAYEALLNESLARQLRVASAAVDWRARALAAESRVAGLERAIGRFRAWTEESCRHELPEEQEHAKECYAALRSYLDDEGMK